MKNIKPKHLGFVIAAFLIIAGWLTRLVGFLALSGVAAEVVDYIGTLVSGTGGVCILGGVVLYVVMSAKEAEKNPKEPLTEEEQREKINLELENDMWEIKNSIPFTAVYGAMAILTTLGAAGIIFNGDNTWFGVSGLIPGLLLSQYYIRKSIRQFKWLSMYKRYKKGEIEMPGNSTIKDKIEKLKSLDKNCSIFGSASHKYELNAPLSDEQIKEFENKYSVTIPADYKQFLRTVGDGGAGPFYGLYKLDFNDDMTPDTAKPFAYTREKPFSMMEAYDQIPDDVSDDEHDKILDDICVKADRGLIVLAHEGCGMYSVLVVNGEEYGNVWYYDLANDAGVFPLTSSAGGPMKFLEWYGLWLDSSIRYLETGEEGFSGYADFVRS